MTVSDFLATMPQVLFLDELNAISEAVLPGTQEIPEEVRWPYEQIGVWTPRVSFGKHSSWGPVHRHGANLFTQVVGSKGWLMAPPEHFSDASSGQSQLSKGDRNSTIQQFEEATHKPDPFLSSIQQKDVCGYFEPEDSLKRVANVQGMCGCVVHPGEALFVPANWWHGTCNLEEWNAGWPSIGFWADESELRNHKKWEFIVKEYLSECKNA
eukprot:gnl/MRDRNA2_/MRDRNA2_79685_c0_seq3.p1 gnl/MRDRNA2_/MRDRNA2_79685_c0~~gnl/MRDRNA2_/MRDRNA2_79685_c0_seq3.p1  ORF type:complete len:211 (+),score=34.37 gnl/MRDRNA2_/MRDRNA2_79685_c0_seq3:81-713(+)